jgi:hypothetical protein
LRYGFVNGHFNPKTELSWNFNKFRQQTIGVEGGKYVSQMNTLNPVDPFINTFYSLFLRENYLKLYEKSYAKINYSHELINGIYFNGSAAYEDRHALTNRSNYAFVEEKEGRVYTDNDPATSFSGANNFADHQALVLNGELRFGFQVPDFYVTLHKRRSNIGKRCEL